MCSHICCKMENTMKSKIITLLQVMCLSFPFLGSIFVRRSSAFGDQIHVLSIYQLGTWTFFQFSLKEDPRMLISEFFFFNKVLAVRVE